MEALPELLAPAGDFEKLRMAVLYGADAVYLGCREYTMRQAAHGFTLQTLPQAVAYCHSRGVRAYLTCNTLLRDSEAAGLDGFLLAAGEAGIDGLIAADLGVLCAARRLLPQVELHVSTQAGVTNYRTAAELYALGARRVVLARELPLEEIRALRQMAPPGLQLEVFVHGAMCMSVSGRCLLSNYLAGRDGNRGACAQPCRWRYRLEEEKRPGEYYPVGEDAAGSYILNAKDLCMIEHLDLLAQAGISSFKIEGRTKSAYYTAVVTNAYRAALRSLGEAAGPWQCPAWAVEETRRVSHRAYCTGFFFGPPNQGQYYEGSGYVRAWDVVAVVEGYEGGALCLTQRNRFFAGDKLEALAPGLPPQPLAVPLLEDGEGRPIPSAPHPMMALRIPGAAPLPPGSLLRKRRPPEEAEGAGG